jgi:hypothetical protein
MFTLGLEVREVVSGNVPEEMTVDVCQKLDVECDDPIFSTALDTSGLVEFEVEAGFDGFVELRSPTTTPSRYVYARPVDSRTRSPASAKAFPSDAVGMLAAVAGFEYDTGLAHILGTVWDCHDIPGDQVMVESDAHTDTTVTRYLINEVPSASASATNSDGDFSIFNLEPGFVTLRFMNDEGTLIYERSIPAEAGFMTLVSAQPDWPGPP